MRAHVDEELLMDVAEGGGDAAARGHVEGCAECAARVAGVREALALADVPVPDPSPLFWEALPRRVDAAIEAGDRSRRRARILAPALLAAAAAVAVAVIVPRPPANVEAPVAPSPLPAWSALPEEDEDLFVLAGAASAPSDLDLAACPEVTQCLASLDEEENRALAAALRDELGLKGEL